MLEPYSNKVAGPQASTKVFSREYCEISKNSFFIEQLQWLLLFMGLGSSQEQRPQRTITFPVWNGKGSIGPHLLGSHHIWKIEKIDMFCFCPKKLEYGFFLTFPSPFSEILLPPVNHQKLLKNN